jgi:hypothetical protein
MTTAAVHGMCQHHIAANVQPSGRQLAATERLCHGAPRSTNSIALTRGLSMLAHDCMPARDANPIGIDTLSRLIADFRATRAH